jgi:ribosomal protein L17
MEGDKLEEMMMKVAERASDKALEKIVSRLDKVIDDKIGKKLKEFGDKEKERFDKLEARLSVMESSRSSAGPSSSAGGTSVNFQNKIIGNGENWKARAVELKGWVTDWDQKDEQGITSEEAENVVTSLVTSLGDQGNIIDVQATKAMNNRVILTKLVIKAKEDENIYSVRAAIKKIIDEGKLVIGGCTPRAVVEAAPHKRPMMRAGGRVYGLIQKKGVNMSEIKWEWNPFRVFVVRSGARPALLCTWTEQEGYKVYPEILNLVLPSMTSEQFIAALK